MMLKIDYATRKEAEARSRAEWEKQLGRPVNPGDTEFAWLVVEDEAGVVEMRVPEAETAKLSTLERTKAVTRIEPVRETKEATVRGG